MGKKPLGMNLFMINLYYCKSTNLSLSYDCCMGEFMRFDENFPACITVFSLCTHIRQVFVLGGKKQISVRIS